MPLIYTFFWFDFSKAIRNDIVLRFLIRKVMKFGEKQLTMLAQTQYSVLSATLRVCVNDVRLLNFALVILPGKLITGNIKFLSK